MIPPTIYLGADHNGFELKQQLRTWLTQRYAIHDAGAYRLRLNDDYPIYAQAVAKAVAAGQGLGILVCGSGHGMAMAANRFRNVRAALCATPFSARMARRDDHANVLVLTAWETDLTKTKKIISAWLSTAPSRAVRYRRRLEMLEQFDNS